MFWVSSKRREWKYEELDLFLRIQEGIRKKLSWAQWCLSMYIYCFYPGLTLYNVLIGMKSSSECPLHFVSALLASLSTKIQWFMRKTYLDIALYTSERTFRNYVIWSNLWACFISSTRQLSHVNCIWYNFVPSHVDPHHSLSWLSQEKVASNKYSKVWNRCFYSLLVLKE